MFDLSYLNASGSLAFDATDEGVSMTTALGAAGVRLWSARQLARDPWTSAQAVKEQQTRPVFGATFRRDATSSRLRIEY